MKSTGPGGCPLGKTWGYDHTSIWVADGYGGEFVTGPPPVAATEKQAPSYPIVQPTEPEWPTWGVIDATGSGGVVHRSNVAELAVGAYALVRYVNQRGNYHWFDSLNVRTNVQFMKIDRSPVSSVFGFYVGGQKGNTVSVATSFYFE